MSLNPIFKSIPGPENKRSRKLYRALEAHLQVSNCLMCKSYPQYGTLIIKGDFFQHIRDVANFAIEVDDFFKLKETRLIEVEQIILNQHRISFVNLVQKEQEQLA